MSPRSNLSMAAAAPQAECGYVVTFAVVSGLTTATLIMALALVGNVSILMGSL